MQPLPKKSVVCLNFLTANKTSGPLSSLIISDYLRKSVDLRVLLPKNYLLLLIPYVHIQSLYITKKQILIMYNFSAKEHLTIPYLA